MNKKIAGTSIVFLLTMMMMLQINVVVVRGMENGYAINYYDDMYVYDAGREIEPPIESVTYTTEEGETCVLKEGTDYIVRYSNNTIAGTGTITVYGRGAYSGSYSVEFTIAPKELTLENVSWEVSGDVAEDDVPTIILQCDEVLLNAGVDYDVTYENGLVTVMGVENYQGRVSFLYEKETKKLSENGMLTILDDELVYTGREIRPELEVSYINGSETIALTEGLDYSVAYVGNVNAGTGTVVVTGKGSYEGSISEDFVILPESISSCEIADVGEATYTGATICPEPRIVFDEQELLKGINYEFSYEDNVYAGTATIAVKGKGNFSGTTYVMFEITPKLLSSLNVISGLSDQIYTGYPIEIPEITVSGLTVEDYVVSYENNTDVGTATITVTGKINYEGEIQGWFRIINVPSGEDSAEDQNADNESADVESTVKKKGASTKKKVGKIWVINKKVKKMKNKSKVVLRWTKASGATKYQIWCRSGKSKKWKRVNITNKRQYTLTVKKKGTYQYRIRGLCGDKKGAFRKITVKIK